MPERTTEPTLSNLPVVPPAPSTIQDDRPEDLRRAEQESIKTLPPAAVRAMEGFRRDLAELLRDYRGQWVAYCGDRRVGNPDPSKTRVWQSCLAAGLNKGDFYVFWIDPYSAEYLHETEL